MQPKPSQPSELSQLRLFQSRLDSQLNPDHPLFRLADVIDWDRFDEAYAPLYCEDNGAPALPTRLMVGLEYLKYTYNLSDEELVMRWLENPYWQYFSGETFFQTKLPLHYTSLGKWWLRIGTERLKLLLEETVHIARNEKFVTDKDLSRVVMDTTVQEKNITFPTDSKLLSRAILKLGKFARHHKITLRQSFARKASGYAAARQFKRLQRCIKDLKNWLERILRDIERKRENTVFSVNFETFIDTAKKLLLQEKHTPKKIYSLHEPCHQRNNRCAVHRQRQGSHSLRVRQQGVCSDDESPELDCERGGLCEQSLRWSHAFDVAVGCGNDHEG